MKGIYGLINPIHQALLTAGVGLLSLPGVHQAVQAALRPAAPDLARWRGEELVSRARRVLAITCHPDDLEFFCGGTLARLSQAGSRIDVLVLTDGEKGGSRPGLGQIRQTEERRAGELLGYGPITFVGLPDYGLENEPRLPAVLAEAWRRAEPDVVFGFDPKELVPGMVNRDHQALGRTLLELAGRPAAAGTQVYFYGTRHANVLVDCSPVAERKVQAVLQHQSQLRYLPKPLYPHLVRLYGSLAGAGQLPQAEAHYRLL